MAFTTYRIQSQFLVATILSMASSVAYTGHDTLVAEAIMDGREEVNSSATDRRLVGDPDGTGSAIIFGIDHDPTTLCYVIKTERIQLAPADAGMAAHIHEGVRDTNGPVVVILDGPEDGTAADCITEGEEGKFRTNEPGIVQRILHNPENFYINVHNLEFPAGAIRGNLRALDPDTKICTDTDGDGYGWNGTSTCFPSQ